VSKGESEYHEFSSLVWRHLDAGVSPGTLHGVITMQVARLLLDKTLTAVEADAKKRTDAK
jgi:hypothetical protein